GRRRDVRELSGERADAWVPRLLEVGAAPTEIVRLEVLEFEVIGEKPLAERAPGENADAAFAAEGQDVPLDVAREHVVPVLRRHDRADGERTLDQLHRVIRQAAVPRQPFGDQSLHFPPRLLDRHPRLGVVQLQEIDATSPASSRSERCRRRPEIWRARSNRAGDAEPPARQAFPTRYRCQASGAPLSSCSPWSSNTRPEPATRSFTVEETRISEAVAFE